MRRRARIVSARKRPAPLVPGAAAARWLRLSGEEREHTGLMAPSHALRRSINDHIRERLARDGAIRGPALEIDRLVSHGYTTTEKSLAAHYAPGDVVGFQPDYRSLGAEKGDERRVVGVDHATGTVMLEGRNGEAIPWQPRRVGGRRGAVEVYRAETIELRAGDRIRWTRNDVGLGLVNSHTAEVHSVEGGGVSFRLEDGRMLALGKDAPQLRHLDHAWASTVHAFQGRTVNNVIAVMEANHPHLTMQKSFYVEISRPRPRAELVPAMSGHCASVWKRPPESGFPRSKGSVPRRRNRPSSTRPVCTAGGAVPGSSAEGLDERQTIRSISEPIPKQIEHELEA